MEHPNEGIEPKVIARGDVAGEAESARECCLTRICRRIIRPIRESISRLTGKEIAVLISETAALGFGVTVALVYLPKLHDYLTSTKWEARDTGVDKDEECLHILERTRGRAMLIYNCTTKKTEWCAKAGEEPVILHNGISEMSFGNYKAVTKPESSDCEGGYKETILKPK